MLEEEWKEKSLMKVMLYKKLKVIPSQLNGI